MVCKTGRHVWCYHFSVASRVAYTYFQYRYFMSWELQRIIHICANYVTTTVGSNKMKVISSSEVSWSRDTGGNSETIPVARFQPHMPENSQQAMQCPDHLCHEFSHLLLYCTSRSFPASSSASVLHVHSCLTVKFSHRWSGCSSHFLIHLSIPLAVEFLYAVAVSRILRANYISWSIWR